MTAEKGEELGPEESLARFIMVSRNIRADGTVKPEAFVPYKHVELSVTRHHGWTESMMWASGQRVAEERGKPLQGRADFNVDDALKVELRVLKAPLEGNPNHADVVDWPPEKAAQKLKAIKIAEHSAFLRQTPNPET